MSAHKSLPALFSTTIWRRGVALARRGAVEEIRGEAPHWQAHVRGSNGRTLYVVELSASARGADALAVCSCPYTFDCKHAAAVAVVLTQRGAAAPDSERQLAEWLAALPTEPARKWALRAVLRLARGEPQIELREVYLRQDGGHGRHRDYSRLTFAAGLASPAERRLLQHYGGLAYLAQSPYSFVARATAVPLSGAVGSALLLDSAASGLLIDGSNDQPLTLGPPLALEPRWREQQGRYCLDLVTPEAGAAPPRILPLEPPVYLAAGQVGAVTSDLPATVLSHLQRLPPIPKARLAEVLARAGRALGSAVPAPPGYEPPTLQVRLAQVNHPARGLPALQAVARYGASDLPLTGEQPDDQWLVRDASGESAAAAALAALGLERAQTWFGPAVPMTRPVEYLAAWRELEPRIAELAAVQGWVLEDAPDYLPAGSAAASLSLTQTNPDWFAVGLCVDGLPLPKEVLAEWLTEGAPPTWAIATASGWRELDMTALAPVQGLLSELIATGLEQVPGLRLAAELETLPVSAPPDLSALARRLKNFRGIKPVQPARGLKAELRDYQKFGLGWLDFLRKLGVGGILADDMGLGKTLQVLAFIHKLKARRQLDGPCLVVAPTSVLWNWLREAERFTPNLSTMLLHGSQRQTDPEALRAVDLVVTSYRLAERDVEWHQAVGYGALFADEAQTIKNAHSKTARALKTIHVPLRYALTGTPLENNLGELWSLLDFAAPGLFASLPTFRKVFQTPIERDGNSDLQAELSRRVAPFMLRRTKAQVVAELPPKTETVQTIELSAPERALYESVRVTMAARVQQLFASKGAARSRIEFLDALLKLRQACIHPHLVKLPSARKIKIASKLQWLSQSLPELLAEGRRVLIFSQFTEMLDLTACALTAAKIDYLMLTGRSRNRGDLVDRFQAGAAPVFLISLKAGGAGLNLTAADTVIHLDPWWNPATEAQATDRAYRIGQDKPVFVYKLIAQDTVEEKIQQLQAQKQALADALFEGAARAGLPADAQSLLALFGR